MKKVFADSNYWIALINPKDQWRKQAVEVSNLLGSALLVTTDEVLVEVLNHFAERGFEARRVAVLNIQEILINQQAEVIPSSHDGFVEGVALYLARLDKGYSLTDCISMNVMRERGITDVLTNDHHFSQEGFHLLL